MERSNAAKMATAVISAAKSQQRARAMAYDLGKLGERMEIKGVDVVQAECPRCGYHIVVEKRGVLVQCHCKWWFKIV